MFEDFEIDFTALAASIAVSLIFIAIMFKTPMWVNSPAFPLKTRIAMSVMLPIISYFIVVKVMNKE